MSTPLTILTPATFPPPRPPCHAHQNLPNRNTKEETSFSLVLNAISRGVNTSITEATLTDMRTPPIATVTAPISTMAGLTPGLNSPRKRERRTTRSLLGMLQRMRQRRTSPVCRSGLCSRVICDVGGIGGLRADESAELWRVINLRSREVGGTDSTTPEECHL